MKINEPACRTSKGRVDGFLSLELNPLSQQIDRTEYGRTSFWSWVSLIGKSFIEPAEA